MKKLIIFSFLLISSKTTAFFDQNHLERNAKSVQIEIQENQVHVEILEKINNPSPENPKAIQFFESIPKSAKNIQFFLDAETQTFEILENASMREALFEQAKKFQNHQFFALGKHKNIKLLKSPEFQIAPNKEIYKKLLYDFEIDTNTDFLNLTLWPKDEIPTKKAEIAVSLVSHSPVQHFFVTTEANGLHLKEENQHVYLLEKTNFTPQEDIQLFWSHKAKAELEFLLQDETYKAHFLPPPPKQNITHLTFLIDQSGSLIGAPWERIQEYTHFWLEKLPEDLQIKIIFFHESLYPYQEEYQANATSFHKEFINYIDRKIPQGKTDLPKVLSLLPENILKEQDHQAVILITDANPPIDLTLLETATTTPIITLDLSPKGSPFLETLAYQSGGFHQKLFRTPWKLVEAEELWSQWTHWTEALIFPEKNKTENEREITPDRIPSITKPIAPYFIGRVHSPSPLLDNANTYFFPKIWAARRIAKLLKTYELENTETLDALLAIGRTFGIKTNFFDESTTRAALKNKFIELKTTNQLPTEIESLARNLEQIDRFIFPSNGKLDQGIPFYHDQNENTWRQFNFLDQVSATTHLQIAPFSEAQKALFVEFPEMVAGNFSIGTQVAFCTIFRCISIKEGARENYLPSDRAFFRDFNPNHWALPYLIHLIDQGILEPEINGKIHPDRPIDRGTFVKMLVEHLWSQVILPTPKINFPDVKNTKYEKAINFLVEKGVIKGYTDGTFRPYQSLTRGEAAKIMLATVGYRPLQPISEHPLFPDANGWEKSWVNETFRRGLAKGFPDGTFRPGQKLTRAEASKLIVEIKRYKK